MADWKGRDILAAIVSILLFIAMIGVAADYGDIAWDMASDGNFVGFLYGLGMLVAGIVICVCISSLDHLIHPGPVKTYSNVDLDTGIMVFAIGFSIYGFVVFIRSIIGLWH